MTTANFTVQAQKQLTQFKLSVSLSLNLTGITGLYGPSGCGKSTLLRIIAGLEQPDVGKINFQQKVLHDSQGLQLNANKRNIGLVFQNSRLFPHLSVKNNLLFARKRCKKPTLNFDEIIALTQISNLLDLSVDQLSGGEQQRVALARALLHEPQLLLLDEPLSALDKKAKVELLQLIKNSQKALNIPFIYVSHSLAEHQFLAQNLLMMNQGTIVDNGAVHEVIHRLNFKQHHVHQTSLSLRLSAFHPDKGLAELSFSADHSLFVPLNAVKNHSIKLGDAIRGFISASDISITLSEPMNTSVVNHLPGTIMALTPETADEMASVVVTISCNNQPFYVLISAYSAQQLNLKPQQLIYIQFKAGAIQSVQFSNTEIF